MTSGDDEQRDRDEGGTHAQFGPISGENVAVSARDMHDVRQQTFKTGQTDISALVGELREALEKHESEVEDPVAIRESADFLEEELAKERPKKSVVDSVLGGLTKQVGHVASLADAVARIQHAVTGIF